MKPTSDLKEACVGFKSFTGFHRDPHNFIRVGEKIANICAMLPGSMIYNMWIDEYFSKQNCCVSSMDGRTKDPWVIQGCKLNYIAITGNPTGFCPDICVTTTYDKVVFSVGGDAAGFNMYDQLLAGIVKNLTDKKEETPVKKEETPVKKEETPVPVQ